MTPDLGPENDSPSSPSRRDEVNAGEGAQHDAQYLELLTRYESLAAEHADLKVHLAAITGRLGFRLLERLRSAVRRLAPWNTRRGSLLMFLLRAAHIVATEGWIPLLKRVRRFNVWRESVFQPLPPGVHLTALDEQYALWVAANEPTESDLDAMRRESRSYPQTPLISLIMPVYNAEAPWLRDAITSVLAQTYGNWQLCIADDGSDREETLQLLRDFARRNSRIQIVFRPDNGGIVEASNSALQLAEGDFVGFIDHDDELRPFALTEVVRRLNDSPELDLIYSDEDKKDLHGKRVEPFFKPDWSPDLLMSMNYMSHFTVAKRRLVEKVGGFRSGFEGSQDHDLFLRLSEIATSIAHIPRPLYSWRKVPGSAAASTEAKPYAYEASKRSLLDALSRRGMQGTVTDGYFRGSYRVRYAIEGSPKISILIPTRDRVDLLEKCLTSIHEKTSFPNFEVVIVDNGSSDPATLAYLDRSSEEVLRYPGPFNYSKMMNRAALHRESDYLLFLNNDTEVIADDWLEAMVEQAQIPEVGCVGARLLYRDGTPQHEGVVVGLVGSAANLSKNDHAGMGRVIRNCSAVTAACMMTRTDVFRGVGGFEEDLTIAFGDVDLCLRLIRAGYRIVYTPFALLYHEEGASRGRAHPPRDEEFFRTRWGQPGEYQDPFYNANFNRRFPYLLDVKRRDRRDR